MALNRAKENCLDKNETNVTGNELFSSVCCEIGKYFEQKDGYKTMKRKIQWTGQILKCEVAFWSSHSNMQNKYVCLEAVLSIYAKEFDDMVNNGVLPIPNKDCNRIFNLYEIDRVLFSEIIDYIEQQIDIAKRLDSKEAFLNFMKTRIVPPFKYNGEENLKILANRLSENYESND